ncbi:MAG: hypothetical protein ABIQ93_01945 [Saprospiraceae bacterium]
MKRLPLFCLVPLLFAALFTFAQRPADWTVNLPGNAQQIIFQNLTGVPIVQTDKAFIGIDAAGQKIAWTVLRGPEKALSFDTGPEFYNLAGAPFVLIRNSVIDSRTGKVVLSKEKDGYKRVEDYEVIPALNSVLVRVTAANGMLRLYLLASDDASVKWKTDVMKPSLITGMNEEPEEEHVDVPLYTTLVTPDKHLVFRYRKSLAVISPEGQLLWIEKADPAEVLLSPDGKKVLVIKALVTGIGNSPVMFRYVTKYRSTKIIAYDLKTGKEAWKDDIKADQNIRWADAHPDFLTVVQKKGGNIYHYATGEAFWTEDFKGRRIVEIQPNAEGYLVTYESGYKLMQLGKAGKPLWAKPKIVETDDAEDDDSPEEGDQDVYQYAKGKVLVNATRARFRPAKGAGLKKWRVALNADSRVAYDDSLHNLLILTNDKIYLINPDANPQVARSSDVNFQNVAGFQTLERRAGGYFFSSPYECVFLPLANASASYHRFPPPFDGEGFVISMVKAELGTSRALLQAQATHNARTGNQKATMASKGLLPPGAGNTEHRAARSQFLAADALGFALSLMPPARVEAFQQSQNFAYYLTSEKNQKLLVKVAKDTGNLAEDRLIFDDARPIYRVDEIEQRVYYVNKGVLKVFKL